MIEDDVSRQRISLNAQKVCKLVKLFDEIAEEVKKLTDKNLQFDYRVHIGAGWFVSVSAGYACVDIRKFYKEKRTEILKPGREGMALRLDEWPEFVKAFPKIFKLRPAFEREEPCYYEPNHSTPEGKRNCNVIFCTMYSQC